MLGTFDPKVKCLALTRSMIKILENAIGSFYVSKRQCVERVKAKERRGSLASVLVWFHSLVFYAGFDGFLACLQLIGAHFQLASFQHLSFCLGEEEQK